MEAPDGAVTHHCVTGEETVASLLTEFTEDHQLCAGSRDRKATLNKHWSLSQCGVPRGCRLLVTPAVANQVADQPNAKACKAKEGQCSLQLVCSKHECALCVVTVAVQGVDHFKQMNVQFGNVCNTPTDDGNKTTAAAKGMPERCDDNRGSKPIHCPASFYSLCTSLIRPSTNSSRPGVATQLQRSRRKHKKKQEKREQDSTSLLVHTCHRRVQNDTND